MAGKPLQIQPKVFDRKYGTVLDSGTTYAYLPEEAYVPFRDALTSNLRSLKKINGADPNYKDICYLGAGSDPLKLVNAFPKVDMVFSNGQKLTLSPENYLFRHSKVHGAYCLGIFQNGKDPTLLLGGILVRNTLVTYDRRNDRIGFWKTNCSELWNRLHIDTPPPKVPSASPNESSTVGVPPPLSPSGLLDNLLPGQIQVGIIIFDLSLNVTYSEVATHLKELAELIAHDLEVNTHQLQLLKFSSEGNSTLIKWAVLPAGSANSISNTTALGIIARLTEHRVHLPKNFGSYQLREWKVGPPSKRSWWKQHLWGVIVSILAVFVLGLSALFALHIWKRRYSGRGTYRPVGAVVPEQELQRL